MRTSPRSIVPVLEVIVVVFAIWLHPNQIGLSSTYDLARYTKRIQRKTLAQLEDSYAFSSSKVSAPCRELISITRRLSTECLTSSFLAAVNTP